MNIHELRSSHFVLWRPGKSTPPPEVFIAQVTFSQRVGENVSPSLTYVGAFPLTPSTELKDVWLIAASECRLKRDEVYHYWFKVENSNSYENNSHILYCTDPFATVVDERVQARHLPYTNTVQSHYSPSSVLKYDGQRLLPSNADGTVPDWGNLFTAQVLDALKPNNQLVIYELPPRWSFLDSNNQVTVANGNFRQVQKMIDSPDNNTYLDSILGNLLSGNKKYIAYLGVNALELTPPANSVKEFDWGYGTSHYLAPDYVFSVSASENLPYSATDLIDLVKACHKTGIRFFYDAVMAFSLENSYRHINYADFFIKHKSNDPEQGNRDGFGGDLVKYRYYVNTYNPNSGRNEWISPAREYMKAHLNEWIQNKGVSGLRLDSVVNIDCYDFLSEVTQETRQFFKDITSAQDNKYIVVAEELSVPASLLEQNRVDGQWNEVFKQILRQVILGKNSWIDASFEWSVKKLIDCRLLGRGFTNGAKAINYITSHDVGGRENERIFNYLNNNGVKDTLPRIKLAFCCLMTAVGIPMILSGEEFADEQDLFDDHGKQNDPVNFQRLANHPWRQSLLVHVRRLIHLRTTSPALWEDYIEFIHSDFNDGKRVMAWKRGLGNDIVVTVANFSSWGSAPNSSYRVNNMPSLPRGHHWAEITQSRIVDDIKAEKIFPWEAKVYAPVAIGSNIFS